MPAQPYIDNIGAISGVRGCALVEIASGMVWHTAGSFPELERMGETASEYWRLHDRLAHNLASLGAPAVGLFAFARGMLALEPCSQKLGVLLVAVVDQGQMDWAAWREHTDKLKAHLESRAF
ncbi:MAG: hypothetical protein ACRCV9_11280 [Burkholderiaceae bacterium]